MKRSNILIVYFVISLFLILSFVQDTAYASNFVRRVQFTNLGEKFKSLSTYAGVFTSNEKNERVYYGATRTGDVCNLFSFNTSTEKVENILSIKDANGAWGVVRDGDYIYIGTYLKASLYKYNIKTKAIEKLCTIPNADYIWDMKLYNNKMYIGTSGNGSLYEYDLKTKNLKFLARITKGQYVRSIEFYNNKIYAGTGANAELIEYDIATGKFKNILSPKYNGSAFVYDLKVLDGKLFMLIRPSNEIAVYDLESNKYLTSTCILERENYINKPDFSEGTIHFTDINGAVIEYNKNENKLSVFNNLSTFKCEIVNDSYLSGITPEGLYVEFNFDGSIRKKVDLIDNGLEGIKTIPMSITANNGKVYLGEKRLGIYDEFDDSMMYKIVSGEPKALCFLSDTLFSANYINAKVWKYDKNALLKPLDYEYSDSEQFMAFSIENNQNRPKAIVSNNVSKTVLIGTEPNYGRYGGALTVYSDVTKNKYTISHIVSNHTIWDITYDNNDSNIAYMGTSVQGGSGTTPLNDDAHVVKWDIQNKNKIWDVVPKKNNHTILSVIHKNNKVYSVTASGSIISMDDKTGRVIKENNKQRFTYLLSSADGNLYGITSKSFCLIAPDSLEAFPLKDDFNSLSYLIAEDTVTGRIYFFDKYNMWRYE